MLHRFYHYSVYYCNETFLVHLVARLIVGCHFVAMCTCSEACMHHKQSRHTCAHYITRSRSQLMITLMLTFLKKSNWLRCTATPLSLEFVDTWQWPNMLFAFAKHRLLSLVTTPSSISAGTIDSRTKGGRIDAENLKVAWGRYYMEVLSDDAQLHWVVNMHSNY